MACYVTSNSNRYYAALEEEYGAIAQLAASHRVAARRLGIKEAREIPHRSDKTGSRTFTGVPAGLRKQVRFDLTTYFTGWDPFRAAPHADAMMRAALGGTPLFFEGGRAAAHSTETHLRFEGPHGLQSGQAVSYAGEIRFVAAVVDTNGVILNAPFSRRPEPGEEFDRAVTYTLGARLPSVSLFDYWEPENAVQRVLTGAAVNTFRLHINGDYHEFSYSGQGSELLSSSGFETDPAALQALPPEPLERDYNFSLVPGHLGQAWLGSSPERFYTLTGGEVILDNNMDLRLREFGAERRGCVAAGQRAVSVDFSLYETTDSGARYLYEAASQRSPISVMFQLGQQTTQVCGVYMKSVVPETPDFSDNEIRLLWHFRNCRAQGTVDDELYVAFG